MGNKKIPHLCGGTLFFLLVQIKQTRAKAREREKGYSDGLSDPDMMSGLVQAITGNCLHAYADSLKKNTSQFRECHINGSTYIPFSDSSTVSNYDYNIKHNYNSALLRMCEFAEKYLDQMKVTWLVRVLLDVMDQDTDISDNALFYVQSDGLPLSKTDVLAKSWLEFQSFLVGIIHYILVNRQDNTAGRDTIEDWGVKTNKNAERKLRNDFQLGKTRTTNVSWYTQATEDKQNSNTDCLEETTIGTDGGFCTDGSIQNQESQTVTIIQQQTNVVQNGEKSVSFVNNGTINIDL